MLVGVAEAKAISFDAGIPLVGVLTPLKLKSYSLSATLALGKVIASGFPSRESLSILGPLVGVHHISGHISANYIEHEELEPPFVWLVASGGHSHLVVVKDYGEYEIIGRTRDDAAGEAVSSQEVSIPSIRTSFSLCCSNFSISHPVIPG